MSILDFPADALMAYTGWPMECVKRVEPAETLFFIARCPHRCGFFFLVDSGKENAPETRARARWHSTVNRPCGNPVRYFPWPAPRPARPDRGWCRHCGQFYPRGLRIHVEVLQLFAEAQRQRALPAGDPEAAPPRHQFSKGPDGIEDPRAGEYVNIKPGELSIVSVDWFKKKSVETPEDRKQNRAAKKLAADEGNENAD